MSKQYNMTHKMLVATSPEEVASITQFLEDFHYEYQYCSLGLTVNGDPELGEETIYPKGVVFAVLKNNNIKDGSKAIFLISTHDIDSDLFKSEITLFEREKSFKFSHTQHNVSIGHNKAKSNSDRKQKHTSKMLVKCG